MYLFQQVKIKDVTVKGLVTIDGSKYSELQIDSTDSVMLEPAQEIFESIA